MRQHRKVEALRLFMNVQRVRRNCLSVIRATLGESESVEVHWHADLQHHANGQVRQRFASLACLQLQSLQLRCAQGRQPPILLMQKRQMHCQKNPFQVWALANLFLTPSHRLRPRRRQALPPHLLLPLIRWTLERKEKLQKHLHANLNDALVWLWLPRERKPTRSLRVGKPLAWAVR